jgi:acyl transferase domain-containing protein
MVAILADPALYQQQSELADCSTLAAVNFDQHFVVATDLTGLPSVENYLDQQISYQRLTVSQAFHSHWLEPAKVPYQTFLADLLDDNLPVLQTPFICCTDAKVLTQLTRNYFWQVIRQPIRFQQTIQYLESQGTYCYIDLGPSGTLATFVKYNLTTESASSTHAVITPYGQEQAKLDALIDSINQPG